MFQHFPLSYGEAHFEAREEMEKCGFRDNFQPWLLA